ncbi:MAG: aminoacetone oxidase family FAD-binding enzyme, partial [Cyclobacteriaceae bacterium]
MAAPDSFDIIVIGGGAAGFFGAINIASINPELSIAILEKSSKLLTKVRISGGGRCNVTHHCYEPTPLSKHYPRGQKELKKLFRVFQASDVVKWFESKGVELKIEKDGRMFPTSDNSETIMNCFLAEANRLGIQIATKCEITAVHKIPDGFTVTSLDGRIYTAKKILIAMGGHAQESRYKWIEELGHKIVRPIPSLFTLNDSAKNFQDLMGVSVSEAQIQ